MCNRNQTNSNDFSDLLPYKGIGTPSSGFSWWWQFLLLFFPPSPNREGMNRPTPAVWMVCVQSEESRLGWCGLQRFCRLLSEQRGRSRKTKDNLACRQTEEVTRHSRRRTEPGGFLWGAQRHHQFVKRQTASSFSWLFSSSCMPLLPFLALSSTFKRKRTASCLQDKSHLVNPSPRLTFKHLYLQTIQPLLTCFHLVFIWSFFSHHPPALAQSLSAKHPPHMVMIIPNFLFLSSSFTPPTSLLLH